MSKNVVIIGGGFGGLAAANSLKKTDIHITIIDRNNHYLFLPLLYQVATAVLSPSDISSPIREILRKQKNARVVMAGVERIDLHAKQVFAGGQKHDYDYLVISSGLRNSYFGRDAWEEFAPGLRTLGDAVKIREKILLSLEKTECVCSDEERQKLLTFVIVGAGPTGVEMAGAIADIKRMMLKDFNRAKPQETRIILLEALDRVLCGVSPLLSAKAKKGLEDLGVEVRLGIRITDINAKGIQTEAGFIETENVIWAAGARSQAFTHTLNAEADKAGRVLVDSCCRVPGHPDVFVIGDAAIYANSGKALPAVAPVAIQQGAYVSGVIKDELRGGKSQPFKYKDKGSIAIIGWHKAVLQSGRFQIWGYPAWLMWMLLHLVVINGFRNRYFVLARWLWFYGTRRHGVRLITVCPPEKR